MLKPKKLQIHFWDFKFYKEISLYVNDRVYTKIRYTMPFYISQDLLLIPIILDTLEIKIKTLENK